MFGDHYNEVGTQKHVLRRPSPDWNFYMAEQKAGRFLLLVARNDTGDVAGYVTMFVRRHPHYDTIIANNDLTYLMPQYRSMGNGKAMIKEAERIATEMGASLFFWRTKKGKSEHGYIFESLGHELTELVYTKDLTDAAPPVG